MRFIEHLPPGARPCALIPGRQKDPRGFIDTGNELVGLDQHVWCSYEGVKQAALIFGFVEGEVYASLHEDLTERIHELEKQVQELDDENSRLEAWLQSVEVMESEGMRAKRKSGRPKQKVET